TVTKAVAIVRAAPARREILTVSTFPTSDSPLGGPRIASRTCPSPRRWPKLSAAMWPSLVVVAHVSPEHTLKMSPSLDEHPVQALHPNRPHPSLGEGVRVRSPDRGGDHPHPFCPEHLVERPGELGVTVADQELNIPE